MLLQQACNQHSSQTQPLSMVLKITQNILCHDILRFHSFKFKLYLGQVQPFFRKVLLKFDIYF